MELSNRFYFREGSFKLINDDTFNALKNFEEKTFDMIFADPPYFLSNNGLTCSGVKMVSVNKGKWTRLYQLKKNMNLINIGLKNVIEF